MAHNDAAQIRMIIASCKARGASSGALSRELTLPNLKDAEESCAEKCRTGNGEDPGEDDARRHPPAHRRKPARCPDTEIGARDGVGGAAGDAIIRGPVQVQQTLR